MTISESELEDSISEEESDSDDYARPSWSSNKKKSPPQKGRGRGRPPTKAAKPAKKPIKTPKDNFPPVSEMVLESIKALKDNPK